MSRLGNIFQFVKACVWFKTSCYMVIALITLQSAFAMENSCASNQNNENLALGHIQSNMLFLEAIAEAIAEAMAEPIAEKMAEQVAEHVAGQVADKESILELALKQKTTHDECSDCNGCPCCSSVIFTLFSINKDFETPVLIIVSLESSLLETPYYSLLRPPKQLNVYLS